MITLRSIIVIQTAFIGDAVLTLPMIQKLRQSYQDVAIDVITIPQTVDIFRCHPAIRNVIVYDKHHADYGLGGFIRILRTLVKERYDAAIIPHRSFRSAIIPALGKIPIRIGFDKSAGAFLMTHVIPYRSDIHEIDRNMNLLHELGIPYTVKELPSLYPSASDDEYVTKMLLENGITSDTLFIAVAPGSVWATKRWLPFRYAELVRKLSEKNIVSVLVGGNEDVTLCRDIATTGGASSFVAAGRLSLLQSASLIRRARILVTNDTAPMHLAVAMRTPVVAIFGATVPAFGFAPYCESDVVVETIGLSCRPCGIHGGRRCPIKTFECMEHISTERVLSEILKKI